MRASTCIYMGVYVCMCVCLRLRVYVRLRARVHAPVHARVHAQCFLRSIFCTIYIVASLLSLVCEVHFAMMMLCNCPVRPGPNNAAAASDPSLAAV